MQRKTTSIDKDGSNDTDQISDQSDRSTGEPSKFPPTTQSSPAPPLPSTKHDDIPLTDRFLTSIHFRRRSIAIAILSLIFLTSIRMSNDNSYEYSAGSVGLFRSSRTEQNSFLNSLAPGDGVRLSRALQHLADVDEAWEDGDVPLFFHVPRSGGSTAKDIMGSCLKLVEASDVGAREGHDKDKELMVLQSKDGSSFVNVDTTTPKGIHHAKMLGLVESELSDVIVTQHLHPAATLFTKNQRGRMFTMIRHPIERAVSLFYYLSVADWEPTYDPDLAYISIEMYARSQRIEHNWMTRFLSNELLRDLTPRHLDVAKEVLRKKCLIGLLNEKGDSYLRFESFFGWQYPDAETKECQDRLLHWGWSNKHVHPIVEEGSPTWDLLFKKNEYDMKLYEYAKQLFKEQEKMFRTPNTMESVKEGW